MDFTVYLFVLIVLAERGARAENKEHGSITDRGVALDESSMKLEELSFAEGPDEEFSHEAHGRELGHECGCHSGSWIKCSAWGSSQCCRCVGTCTCFGYVGFCAVEGRGTCAHASPPPPPPPPSPPPPSPLVPSTCTGAISKVGEMSSCGDDDDQSNPRNPAEKCASDACAAFIASHAVLSYTLSYIRFS